MQANLTEPTPEYQAEHTPFPTFDDIFPVLLPRDTQRKELFRLAMKRHGQPAYWMRSQSEGRVLAWLRNKVRDEARFDLTDAQLKGIAHRVAAYLTANLTSGRTQAGLSESQANKGRLSGVARRAATAERDAEITARVMGGEAKKALAREYDLDPATIRRILRRGMRGRGGTNLNQPTPIGGGAQTQALNLGKQDGIVGKRTGLDLQSEAKAFSSRPVESVNKSNNSEKESDYERRQNSQTKEHV